jgi:hypothetical protein
MADGPVPIHHDMLDVYADISDLNGDYILTQTSDMIIGTDAASARTGSRTLRIRPDVSGTAFLRREIPATRRVTVNFAYSLKNFSFWGNQDKNFFTLSQASQAAVMAILITQGDNGVMQLRRGTDILLTAPKDSKDDLISYWEIAVFIDSSSGYCKVWRDGVVVFDFTGNTGNADIVRVNFGPYGFASFSTSNPNRGMHLSDIVICRHEGTPAADQARLGPVIHTTIVPDSDFAVDGTPSSGSDNYAMVNEVPMDGDTSYVTLGAVGDKDIYGHSTTLPVDTQPISVLVRSAQRLPLGGTTQVRQLVNDGTNTEEGPDLPVGELYTTRSAQFEENPFTNDPWEKAEVEALNFGVEARPAP